MQPSSVSDGAATTRRQDRPVSPLASRRPGAGRYFGNSTGREVSQAREYRAKIVANLHLKSSTGFNDRDVGRNPWTVGVRITRDFVAQAFEDELRSVAMPASCVRAGPHHLGAI